MTEPYIHILELIQQKDPEGLKVLYEIYGKKFYAYAVIQWKLDEDQAWEVVYKTLETLVLKLPAYQFESKAHFENFLYKVLTNFLRQYFRQKRAQERGRIEFVSFDTEGDEDRGDTVQISDYAFETYYDSENAENPMLRLLKQCLEKLRPLERDLLLLRAQNYTYDEIANMLKIENAQLKVKYLRAKQKLTTMMKEIQTTMP